MVYISENLIIFVTVLVYSGQTPTYCSPLEKGLFCDPMEHKYYRAQFGVCGDCDKCFPGDEITPPDGVNLGFGLHGATLCLGCQPCKKGTFNSDDDLQWYCSPCTVCANVGMVETHPCTPTHDTICSNTAPSLHPRLNTSNDSSMELPFKGKDIQYEDPLYSMFLAITALSLTFLFSVAVAAYCLCKKKHRRRSVKTEELVRLYIQRKDDERAHEDSGLHVIEEEISEDGEDIFSPNMKYDDKRQRKQFNYRTGDLKEPLLRRRQSLHIDFQRMGNKVGPTDISTSRKDVDSKTTGKPFIARSLQRRQSLPITVTELDGCKSSFYQRAPSDGFVRYLSKLMAGDRAYRKFAKEVGVEEFNIKLIETEFEGRHLADVSYEVIKRVLQIKPNLRVIDIYNILDRLGFQSERKSLQEKIENFRISLT
ncbi:uncharacterized protein LOC117329049 [Pecten maximus]|uniref:uncharacterized protein LOC117329049 n=1 Tax=Pecten maximus TaxID=6579 RepID=UPI00145840E6|nr:uncharacterized protein LOC117329049 [Pecten maximus]